MTTKVQQPMIIEHGGHRYERFRRLSSITAGITEGPFYRRPGVNEKDWAYTPDLPYLLGQSKSPSFMHCIQQRDKPTTPRPKA